MRYRIGLGILVVLLAIGSVAWGMVSENSRQGSDPVFSITHQGVELLNPVSDAGSDGTSEENCIGVNNRAKHLTPYLFTGRKLNSFTGQYFNRNRHYQPRTGRFTSSDPIGFGGGYNLWTYCNNNPTGYADSWGLLHKPVSGYDPKTKCYYVSTWGKFDHSHVHKTLLGQVRRNDYHEYEITFLKCECPPPPPADTGVRVAILVTTRGPLISETFSFLTTRTFTDYNDTSFSRAAFQDPSFIVGVPVYYPPPTP